MGAKKIIIPIVIAAVVGVGVGVYSYNTVKANNLSASTTESISSNSSQGSTTLSSTSGATSNTTTNGTTSNTNKTTSQNSSNATSTNSATTKSNNNASAKATASNSGATSTSSKTTSNTNASSNSSANSTSKTTTTNSSSSNNNTNSTGTTQGTENSGTISYSVPNTMYQESTVLVENTTGKPISQALLNEYLRSWIMVGQANSYGICDASGTLWEEPWLNQVSQETLYQAFIDANGEAALSQNITDSEFIKATQELDKLTMNDVPFTLPEAKSLILQMLQEDGYATPSEVTKIVLVKGSPSIYEVYTKESGDNAFWFVVAYSGYAHGGGKWY